MRRALAILGSALFLVIAPGIVVVLVPWWISKWHVQESVLRFPFVRVLGVLLILGGLPVLLEPFARFALQGLGYACPRLSDASSRGERVLSVCAKSYVLSSCVPDFRSGLDAWEWRSPWLWHAGLAGLSRFCFGLRGTDPAEHFWR
jgi:hypothetical protein